jgi:hypothetical protein
MYITPAQYHADPCETPSLSASTAKTLAFRSAAHAWLEHPRFGRSPENATDDSQDSESMTKGTIIHELVLGKGSGLVVIEADNFRTNAAKAERDAALAAGKTPVIAAKMEYYQIVADKIRKRIVELIERPIPTAREVCIEWQYHLENKSPGLSPDRFVLCRSMLDAVDLETGYILDLKTSRSANQLYIEKAFCSNPLGYDIQAETYRMAVEDLKPDLAGRVKMDFAFAEIEPPYSVTIGRPSAAMQALGRSRWARAAEKWDRCLRRGVEAKHWPHYADKIVTLYPPTYEVSREEEIIQCEL